MDNPSTTNINDRSHPNVVFIVGDNVGWGDINCYGAWRRRGRRAAAKHGQARAGCPAAQLANTSSCWWRQE